MCLDLKLGTLAKSSMTPLRNGEGPQTNLKSELFLK